MDRANNKVLVKMLDRLFAAIVSGPSLNCRPYSSRQRIDLTSLAKLEDISPPMILGRLLGEDRAVIVAARVPPPKKPVDQVAASPVPQDAQPSPPKNGEQTSGQSAVEQDWNDQQNLLNKLRAIAEDARTYEQDTGVYALNLGFPLLSLPPNALPAQRGGGARRILAPLAFVPISLTIQRGPTPSVELACKGDGIDLVFPNAALLAWLEQQTGKAVGDLFTDEDGKEPWREVCEVVRRVCTLLDLPVPDVFVTGSQKDAPAAERRDAALPGGKGVATGLCPALLNALQLESAPRADEAADRPLIYLSAVLGLFPLANQGLLRDMQAMVAGEGLTGPVEGFIRAGVSFEQAAPDRQPAPAPGQREPRLFSEERLVTAADPCQARAVKQARQAKGLVIHGPPGTGKSQTITNIIGDHLARGQRVLLVCDKRTALDVVANRLEHMGLGSLCALVHDPQRDQRDLYRAIREQLDALAEVRTDENAQKRLAKTDQSLQKLHDELTQYWEAVMACGDGGMASFHELMGQWLSLAGTGGLTVDGAALADVTAADLERHEPHLQQVLERGEAIAYAGNPWVQATSAGASIALREFLSHPMQAYRTAMAACVAAAQEADATIDPAIPPLARDVDLLRQAQARTELARLLEDAIRTIEPAILARWARKEESMLAMARQRLSELSGVIQTFRAGPLDAELALGVRSEVPRAWMVTQQLGAIEAYLPIAGKWYAAFCFKRKSSAAGVARHYGLPLSASSTQRLRDFLIALRARLALQNVHGELLAPVPSPGLLADDALDASITQNARVIELLARVHSDPALAGLGEVVRKAMAEPGGAPILIEGLRKSAPRAEALARLQGALAAAGVFHSQWLARTLMPRLCDGHSCAHVLTALAEQLDTLDGVLRIREGLLALPDALRSSVQHLLEQAAAPEGGLRAIRKAVLAGEITRRLQANPALQGADARHLQSSFDRYRKLEEQKQILVRDAILHQWISRQKERLLAGTGTRLNSLGADLRRRLMLRGERALRLRQVVAIGQSIEGGDPLFDICPVWMASPETVAQVFPRKPAFDIVIFDEASQCRLEEALPVLTRARRLVIAGDPQQLPPTRFFESAVAASDDEEAVETEQQLFELQQGEIEDLLAASLNLEIEQAYLDVHYRSRNADLIGFSNEHFYASRLQAIPAHPSHRPRQSPLSLYRVDGVYDKRVNPAEAERVCAIVRDLLASRQPPSIGIACFNIQQRDLIVEHLDDLAAEDEDFARRLAEARSRVGAGSFEGLFVKNLENVQGDERDHIIISTTYGPDPKGRFYRRFGPLAMAGGGRRLNVLVTRARQQVHLVTSIPREAYRNLPPVPAGTTPSGVWLLFAYLAYAEDLAQAYEQAGRELAEAETTRPASVHVLPSRSPSLFAQSLARILAEQHQIGSAVHWGNDGFCVDIALHHPERPEEVTVGILCDASRFDQARDPVEWDIFRTAIHESQGWRLHRLWTPHFFRDSQGCIEAILKALMPDAGHRTEPRA